MSCFFSSTQKQFQYRLSLNTLAKATVLASSFVCLSTPSQAATFRSIDGSNNNITQATWGQSGTQLTRIAPAAYGDGISTPAGTNRPSARTISNGVSSQSEPVFNALGASDLLFSWGQFLDHDISLTTAHSGEAYTIPVPQGDRYFDPYSTGTQEIFLNRSSYDPKTGTTLQNPRQQVNEITAWIDASMVYGSDQERADALRTFQDGQLKISAGNLLPFNEEGLPNERSASDANLFLAGDVRVNEQPGLIALHTLFVREHNRLASQIALATPTLTDEEIYQQARAIVGGQIQAITYNEFLPILLGPNTITPYSGYDPAVNPSIANEFSTAAFRMGHTLINPTILRLDEQGTTIPEGNLALRDAFFNLQPILEQGIESIFLGLAAQKAQEFDPLIIEDLRNFLFGPPGSGGFDLASLNIQRGRDHGLASYNDTRKALGLAPVADFPDISSDQVTQSLLASVYTSVDDIDLWIGGLAEDSVDGGLMGATFSAILRDQFERLRAGDRFWYQNSDWFSENVIQEINNTTLSNIIIRNTNINSLQGNAFIADDQTSAVPTPALLPGLLGILATTLRKQQRKASNTFIDEANQQ